MLRSEIVIGLIIFMLVFLLWTCVNIWKALSRFYDDVLTPHCHMCGCETEVEYICDTCEEFCCFECARKHTYMNPMECHRCEDCASIYD